MIADGSYKPSYLHMIHNVLSMLLAYATRFCGLAQNPAIAAGSMGTKRREKESIKFWDQEQFARFILSGLKPEYIALFSVLFWCGLRVGECRALTARDVDLEAGTIDVNKTMTRGQHGDVVGPPKTLASRRVVTMPLQLSMILSDWIRGTAARGNDRLFVKGTPMICRVLHSHARRAGLPEIRVHDLRHSHASMLINAGVPAKVVQERLGHASIQITLDLYSHLYPSRQKDVAALLSKNAKI